VVRYIADRIAVLYRGRIVEIGPAEAVFAGPHHPYTAALLSAVPALGHKRVPLPDGPPGPDAGCVFSGRCPRKLGPVCETEAPPFEDQDGHAIRCHIPRDALDVAPSR
jgi:peptide/nickel transport system ATP-binding protein